MTTRQLDRSRLEAGAYKFDKARDARRQLRISQRELGRVAIAVQKTEWADEQKWVNAKLWDFSSISLGIRVDKSDWEVGDRLKVRLQAAAETHVFECTLMSKRECQGAALPQWHLGLRREDVTAPQGRDGSRREDERLRLAPAVNLVARIKHPFLFAHWCHVRAYDVNRSMGFAFECQDPSLLVFIGMTIDLHFELPGMRLLPLKARVAWVFAEGDHCVRFGVSCVAMDFALHNSISDFLLVTRHWSPARLREAGFRVQQVKQRLRFRTVKNGEDYEAVLLLRRDAYVGAGRKPEGTPPEAMAGRLDKQSRIITAWHGSELVGSLTFAFPNSEDVILDSEAGFPGHRYPVQVPRKTDLIEVSRLCIHQAYRSTDLLQGLFEHGMQHFLSSERKWLLSSAIPELLPLYLRIGFKTLGATYRHPALGNAEHHLISAHRDAFLKGKGMRYAVWLGLFGDVLRFLVSRHGRLFSITQRLRLAPHLIIHPLMKRMIRARLRRAFKQYLATLRTSGELLNR